MVDEKKDNDTFEVSENETQDNANQDTLEVNDANLQETQNQDTVNVNENDDETLEVNEEVKETTVNEAVKETTVNEAVKETTVNEKNKETTVNEQVKVPEEQKANDEKKTGSITRKPDEIGGADYDDKEDNIFKAGDIIDYMYNDWLIAGLNGIWKWCCKKTKSGYYDKKYKQHLQDAQKPAEKALQSYDTYKKMNDAEKKAVEDINAKEALYDNDKSLIEQAQKIREGNYEGLTPQQKARLQNADPKKLNQFLDTNNIAKCQEAYNSYRVAAAQFANNYAQLMFMDAKMRNPDDPEIKDIDKAMAKFKNEGYLLFARSIENAVKSGKSAYNTSAMLKDNVDKGLDVMRKNVVKGNFVGYSKKKWLGRKSKGQYKENKYVQNLLQIRDGTDMSARPKQSMHEALLNDLQQEKSITKAFDVYMQEQLANDNARAQNNVRRVKLNKLKSRLSNNYVQQHQAHRQSVVAQNNFNRLNEGGR